MWLKTFVYEDLFIADNAQRRAKLARPQLWRTTKTNIWSIIPPFPHNSLTALYAHFFVTSIYFAHLCLRGQTTSHSFVEHVDRDREVNLIKYVTQQNFDKWTVGPLDFCGIARLQRMVGVHNKFRSVVIPILSVTSP